jgi:hypothetical protein
VLLGEIYMDKEDLKDIKLGDTVEIFFMNGNSKRGEIKELNNNRDMLCILTNGSSSPTRFSYAMIYGIEVINTAKPLLKSEEKIINTIKVSNSTDLDFTGVLKIVREQGVIDLSEWKTVKQKYDAALKNGEFAKKHRRMSNAMAELESIKEKFRDVDQYHIVYDFFKNLEDKAEAELKARKEQREVAFTVPRQEKLPSPVESQPVVKAVANEPVGWLTGTVVKAVPDYYNNAICNHWVVQTTDNKTYIFRKRNIIDMSLVNSLEDKFKKNGVYDEKIKFRLNYYPDSRYNRKYYADDVQYASNVGTQVLFHDDIVRMAQMGKMNDEKILPFFIKYFNESPNFIDFKFIWSLHIRMGNPLEAVDFILKEKSKIIIPDENVYQFLYEAYRKAGLYEEAYNSQKNIIKCALNDAHKAHHILIAVSYSYNNKLYEDSLKFCEEWLKTDIGKSASNSTTRALQLSSVCRYAAMCIIQLRSENIHYKASPRLQKAIDSNADSAAILSGKIKLNEVSEVMENNDSSDGVPNLFLMYSSDIIGTYVNKQLERIDLLASPNTKLKPEEQELDNQRCFIGTLDSAMKLAESVTDGVRGNKPDDRYTRCIYAARLLSDAIRNNDNSDSNFELQDKLIDQMYHNIARALTSKGDKALQENSDETYISRFYYTEAIRVGSKQDKINAITRCVLSVFADRKTIDESFKITNHQDKNLTIDMITNYLNTRDKAYELDIPLLLSVLVRIISSDKIQKAETQKSLISAVFSSSDRQYIAIKLFNSNGHSPKSIVNNKEIEEELEKFRKSYVETEHAYIRFVDKIKALRFERDWIEDIRHQLKEVDVFFKLTEAFDKRICVDKVNTILDLAEQIYDAKGTFKDQERELKTLVSQIRDNRRDIEESPSYYAYEYMLPVFNTWSEIAEDKLSSLYSDNPPSISGEIVRGNIATMDEDGNVLLFIEIFNGKNTQNADNVDIKLIDVPDIYEIKNVKKAGSRTIEGGQKKTVEVFLKLSKLDIKVFTMPIKVHYSYKVSNANDIKDGVWEEEIPITFNESKTVISVNPYNSEVKGNGVSDRNMMFGREALIKAQIEKLKGLNGTSPLKGKTLLFHGQKRAGKSTVLHYLTKDIKEYLHDFILVDIGDINKLYPSESSFEKRFTRKIFEELSDQISDESENHKSLFNAMNEAGIIIPDAMSVTDGDDGRDKMNRFFKRFNRLTETQPEFKNKRVILLIDEFTKLYVWIQENKLDKGFMQYWKAIIFEFGLVAVIIAQDTIWDFQQAFPNTFQAIDDTQIGYLEREAVKEMVTKPFERIAPWGAFPDDHFESVIDRIMELTSGNAYFTMVLLDRLVQYMKENNQPFVIRRILDIVLEEEILNGNNAVIYKEFDSFYNDSSDIKDFLRKTQNLAILRAIARYQDERNGYCPKSLIDVPEEIANRLELTDERVSELLERLHLRGVLHRTDTRDEYGVRVGIFKEWLIKKCSDDTINTLMREDEQEERV